MVEMHYLWGATTYLALFCAISFILKHCFFYLVDIGISSLETHLWFDLLPGTSKGTTQGPPALAASKPLPLISASLRVEY